jgi:hypothetical protein
VWLDESEGLPRASVPAEGRHLELGMARQEAEQLSSAVS